MSGAVVKYLFKRQAGNIKFGADPYFEQGDSKHKKFKPAPLQLSKNDTARFKKVRRRAYRLDESITCCCCSFRFGWSAVITFIPLIGDIIAALLARNIITVASGIDGGLPDSIKAQMYANLVLDVVIGITPVVGSIVTMFYKANTRNLKLLESHLIKSHPQTV